MEPSNANNPTLTNDPNDFNDVSPDNSTKAVAGQTPVKSPEQLAKDFAVSQFFIQLVKKYKQINLQTKSIFQLQHIAKRAAKELPLFLKNIRAELVRRNAINNK
jgi:1,2-phenylacetyl-CoA epoxidase catalytic subunit